MINTREFGYTVCNMKTVFTFVPSRSHEFPDHHDYSISELSFNDTDAIISTEKDAVKLKTLLKQHPEFNIPIWVVPVEAVLSDDCYVLLKQQLQALDIHFS